MSNTTFDIHIYSKLTNPYHRDWSPGKCLRPKHIEVGTFRASTAGLIKSNLSNVRGHTWTCLWTVTGHTSNISFYNWIPQIHIITCKVN